MKAWLRRDRKWWVRRAFRCCIKSLSGEPSVGKGKLGIEEIEEIEGRTSNIEHSTFNIEGCNGERGRGEVEAEKTTRESWQACDPQSGGDNARAVAGMQRW